MALQAVVAFGSPFVLLLPLFVLLSQDGPCVCFSKHLTFKLLSSLMYELDFLSL